MFQERKSGKWSRTGFLAAVEWGASRAEWDAAAWVDFPEAGEWADIPAGDTAVAVVET